MQIVDLGIKDYRDTLQVQTGLLNKRIGGEIPDTVIAVEHLPVITLGRTADSDDIIDSKYFLERNVPVIRAARGGEITYHSPGQLIVYPIVDLKVKQKDISLYLDRLEISVQAALKELEVPALRVEGKRGIWVGDKKIAFFGIAIKRWVTYHGISINVNNDIDAFKRINPCGEKNTRVTSVKECLGREVNMEKAKEIILGRISEDLGAWHMVRGKGDGRL